MSRINEIQTMIKSLSPGAYQKLMDAYLHKKYEFENIETLGMRFNEKVYLRVADQSIELTCSQINALEYDKGQRFFEDQIIEDATLNDLNQKLLAVYQEKMKVTTKTPAEILEARGLIRNGKLTNVAILLFEENPTKFLQSARIRFLRYNGQKAGLGQNITENKKSP